MLLRGGGKIVTISVLIPTYKRSQGLERCLEGIANQTRQPDEVIVVYRQGSDVKAEDMVSRFQPRIPNLRGVGVTQQGVVSAMRAGVDNCTMDVMAITDDDAVPRKDWLQRIEQTYNSQIGGVGGRDIIHGPSGIIASERNVIVGKVTILGRMVGNHHVGSGSARDVDVLKGANMSLRRELWNLDARFEGRGAQPHWELYLCLRARAMGWRLVYDPNIIVDHYPAYRPSGDDRTDRTATDVQSTAYNLTLALISFGPRWKARLRLGYRILMGSKDAPGVIRVFASVVRFRSPSRGVVPTVRGAIRAFKAVAKSHSTDAQV